jgi:hypothetical protein
VEIDLAKEKAFIAARHAFPFRTFLRILFLDLEVRFFGTAITNNGFNSYIIYCDVKDILCISFIHFSHGELRSLSEMESTN